jgi:CheY-like chemotaxis protein
MWPQDQSPSTPLLIVDDDAAIRNVIRLIFEDGGYTITEASTGYDALALLRERSEPHVVLLDDRMPELGGEDVLRLIMRDRELRRRHTFILVSGTPRLSRRLRLQRMLRALAIEVIPKPFDVTELEEAVARAQARQHSRFSFSLAWPHRLR